MYDTLINLGFRKNDALVYLALVEIGPCFVAPLVKHTKKHRQIVYNSLNTLLEKHLINVAERNGKNYYSISDPQRLLVDLKQKEVVAQSLVQKIEEKQKVDQEQVEVFAGKSSYEKGTADFRRHALESKEYVVVRGETKGWFEHTRGFFPVHVDELNKLKRNGVDVMIAFFEHDRANALKFLGPHLGNPYICKIAPDDYKLPHTVWLAGDHVYLVTPAVDPVVIHIKSPYLAAQYRDYFWHIWGKGKMLEK
jgi:predicted transcriptional regulator